MRLNSMFTLPQVQVAHLMRSFAVVCAGLLGICCQQAVSFAATEYVIVVKVLQSDDKGIIERKNGERWLIENGAGALSFRRYEGKKVLIDSPGFFCGVGSKMILPDDDQEARVWSAEKIDEHPVRPLIDKSAFRGEAGIGLKENTTQSVSLVSGTASSGLMAESAGSPGAVEPIPNRLISRERMAVTRPGLLGKRHASAQLLVGRAHVEVHDSSASLTLNGTGVGWFTQVNAPLLVTENEAIIGLGIDAFGSLGGSRLSGPGAVSDGIDTSSFNFDSDAFGGNVGVNVFYEAAESIRPFVQLGVCFLRTSGSASTSTDNFVVSSETNSSLLFGVGAELDVVESIAFRTSVVPALNGSKQVNFVNELFVNPQDRWFLRMSLITTVGAGCSIFTCRLPRSRQPFIHF
ncbi:MAG: hypothetical protein NTZ86_08775 [Legionellales bacterium]|nr:hypothetical protein [Legionellales bacterium]